MTEIVNALHKQPRTIALIGNSVPRRCGIATFSTDLLTALAVASPESNCYAVVINDGIEDNVTYANGKISQALLLCGHVVENPEMLSAALQSLSWLVRQQTNNNGHFSLIGNRGGSRGRERESI